MVCALLVGAATAVAFGWPGSARASVPRGTRSWPSSWPFPSRTVPVLLAGVVLLGSGPVAAIGVLLVVLLGRRALTRRRAARAREAERAGAGEALAVLASELRAGRPPGVALEVAAEVAVGPLASALSAAAASGRLGADPAGCLLRGADASAVPQLLRGLGVCWQVCGSTGSSLAAAVERLAEGMRAEQVQRRAVDAELAGPRATAAMLAALPLAGIALAAGLGARPVHMLLHTPLGMACLGVGVGLDLFGLWWTDRLVTAAGGAR